MEYTRNKRWILGLLLSCPLSNPLCNCPINELRNQSFEKLISIVEELNDSESESILTYHKKCLFAREHN